MQACGAPMESMSPDDTAATVSPEEDTRMDGIDGVASIGQEFGTSL